MRLVTVDSDGEGIEKIEKASATEVTQSILHSVPLVNHGLGGARAMKAPAIPPGTRCQTRATDPLPLYPPFSLYRERFCSARDTFQ
jgi:hypothetical protein